MKFKPADVSPTELDMTPMIDIVFQLITFFMVINKFDQEQTDERVMLPRDQLARPAVEQRKDFLVLNIGFDRDTTNGAILDPTPLIFFGDDRLTVEQIRPRLVQESQFYKTIGTALEDVTVEIRADAQVPSGVVQELIQVCQETGVEFQRFALKATQVAR